MTKGEAGGGQKSQKNDDVFNDWPLKCFEIRGMDFFLEIPAMPIHDPTFF